MNQLIVAPHLIYRPIDDILMIFDPETGDTHELDVTGREVFYLFVTGSAVDDCVATLSAEYDAPAEEIKNDVIPFVDRMLEVGVPVPAP